MGGDTHMSTADRGPCRVARLTNCVEGRFWATRAVGCVAAKISKLPGRAVGHSDPSVPSPVTAQSEAACTAPKMAATTGGLTVILVPLAWWPWKLSITISRPWLP